MYEIHEDRTVTHDGKAADDGFHFATVESDGGKLTIKLADYSPDIGFLKPEISMSSGEVGFETKDLLAALLDLSRIAGLDTAEARDMADAQERAAAVVERVCHRLESAHDPVDHTLASDLRATMLQLIHLATSPSS